jgi:DeoR family transcriptional regulator of aga operon
MHERQLQLLEVLGEHHRIEVDEAAELLGVCRATIRRDLDHLARQRMLTRTHGGAVPVPPVDLGLPRRSERAGQENHRIARAVAGLLPLGSVVGMTGGTMAAAIARELAARPDLATRSGTAALTVVTNAINIANSLAGHPFVRTAMTGGVAQARSFELAGPLAEQLLPGIFLDHAVVGVDALDLSTGAGMHDERRGAVSRAMIERAERVIVAARADSLDRRAFARVCTIEEIAVLVTDRSAPAGLVEALGAAGIEVHCV